MIKEQIQWQSQRLISSQCTYYSLFVDKELATIEIFLLDFSGGQKCVIKRKFLLIFLKRVEKDPFLRPQIRAKDTFI